MDKKDLTTFLNILAMKVQFPNDKAGLPYAIVLTSKQGEGKNLSWAPLIPTGNIFNPLIFEFNERSVMFQTQLPWIILPPFLYMTVIKLANKRN